MRKFASFGMLTLMASVVAVGVMLYSSEVEARPNYKKAFDGEYSESLKKTDCNVCHEGKDKKNRNDYGKAFGKALGATKVSKEDKIKEALEKAGKEKSAVDGKTFADLIKDGKTPASKE